MKIIRASKCTLKYVSNSKIETLEYVLKEYGNVVNFFINHFWNKSVKKNELLKPIIDLPKTWLSARFRKVAAREALDMTQSSKKRNTSKPTHSGKRMYISSTIADLVNSKTSKKFDCWLQLRSIGKKIKIDLPINFNILNSAGKRLNSYIITKDYIQFCFEIITKEKKKEGNAVGLDTGINSLAALSNGKQLGCEVKQHIEKIKRCKHGSKAQKRKRRALKQYMDEVSKEIYRKEDLRLIVVESLKGLNNKSKFKRRLNKSIRRSIGVWAYRYWLNRLQQGSEWNRVSFRSVNPAYTSQKCFKCGHTDRKNRRGEVFQCLSCGHKDNADKNAAKNILDRFFVGPYGADFKPKIIDICL